MWDHLLQRHFFPTLNFTLLLSVQNVREYFKRKKCMHFFSNNRLILFINFSCNCIGLLVTAYSLKLQYFSFFKNSFFFFLLYKDSSQYVKPVETIRGMKRDLFKSNFLKEFLFMKQMRLPCDSRGGGMHWRVEALSTRWLSFK